MKYSKIKKWIKNFKKKKHKINNIFFRCDTEQGGDGTLFFGSRQDRSVYSPGKI